MINDVIFVRKRPRQVMHSVGIYVYETQSESTYLLTCASNEDSDQPPHLHSLVRVFVVRMKKHCILRYLNKGPGEDSDCVNTQADLNPRWAHTSERTFSVCAVHISFNHITFIKMNLGVS